MQVRAAATSVYALIASAIMRLLFTSSVNVMYPLDRTKEPSGF